jgi:arylsulfatase A-like enzyme
MRKRHGRSLRSRLTAGILVGLGWGLLAALLEGLPLLLQGSPWAYLGERLLALAYLAAIYGLLCALAGGLVGVGLWLISRLTAWKVEQPASKITGLFAAATLTIFWVHRFDPGLSGWAVVVLLAAGLGVAVAWLLGRVARGSGRFRAVFGSVTVGLFLVAVLAVGGVAGFRALLRDRPSLNPPVTDQVATAERPNIVLITAGGIRPDHLGVYGYGAGEEPAISPNIDALAGRGTRFEQAFAAASWGEPSLASLLTSLYPSELGIDCRAAIHCTPQLDADRVTLAEALKAAGYRTQAYVTDPWLTAEFGFDQGFDGFETVRSPQPFDLGALQSGTLGRLLGCRQSSAACRLLAQGYDRLFDAAIPQGWGGDHVNARVGHFLELHGNERFFLWIHYTEALPPYNLEAPFRPLADDPLASPAKRLKRLGYWELGDPFTARQELLPLDTEGLISLYDAEVHRVDRLVGGVTGLLDGFGLADRTVVVFTADHGQEFMEHGGYTYGHSLYDEVLRVPLIVAGPGVGLPGQAVATPASLLDLAPTLAEFAGASLEAEAEGRSLMPALRGEALAGMPVYGESLYRVPYELKALRADGYKLIYNVDDGTVELYDTGADPPEQFDISSESGQVADRMKGALLEWMAHTRQVASDLPRSAPPTEVDDAVW